MKRPLFLTFIFVGGIATGFYSAPQSSENENAETVSHTDVSEQKPSVLGQLLKTELPEIVETDGDLHKAPSLSEIRIAHSRAEKAFRDKVLKTKFPRLPSEDDQDWARARELWDQNLESLTNISETWVAKFPLLGEKEAETHVFFSAASSRISFKRYKTGGAWSGSSPGEAFNTRQLTETGPTGFFYEMWSFEDDPYLALYLELPVPGRKAQIHFLLEELGEWQSETVEWHPATETEVLAFEGWR